MMVPAARGAVTQLNNLFNGDVLAFCTVSAIMVIWVELVKLLSNRKLLSVIARRKIMHICTGPIFLFTWPLFSSSKSGRIAASLVPVAMTLKFFLIGLGIIHDEDAIHSMSRTGDRRELLRGPTLYGTVFVLATYLFWMDIRAVIALGCLCFGDGFAEIIGRKFGKIKLPWSNDKSWAGSLGFVVASCTLTSLLATVVMAHNPAMKMIRNSALFPRLLFSSLAAAAVESLPLADVDNVTIFIAAALADTLFCAMADASWLPVTSCGIGSIF